ncbi:Superoxide dismutase [Cu-Zn] [Thelohanellus kitauei]|uniref:Superoxide dismutase [Cu-Zn] n=1 Tax=Thelohanellus kitauei TaxID=669202 RepID=A0A0C2JFA7_THEKT|nr:Superoxide dismutase [Cu-Zn] [Thelohanellus kitauei]
MIKITLSYLFYYIYKSDVITCVLKREILIFLIFLASFQPVLGDEPYTHDEWDADMNYGEPEPGANAPLAETLSGLGITFDEPPLGHEEPSILPVLSHEEPLVPAVPSHEEPLVPPVLSHEEPVVGPVSVDEPPYLQPTSGEEPLKKKCEAKCAVAVVKSPTGEVSGILYFYQNTTCSKIHLHGHLCFLHIRSKSVGFHIHEYGDVSDGCNRIGPHYNPYHLNHGPLYARNRHVGDLGNVNVSCYGQSEICLDLPRSITLWGRKSIVGRSIAIDSNQDDLGLGGNEQSLITGNSPPTIGCGVIGVSKCDCYDEEEPTCPG